ncbi:MAG TPA: aminopeptidase P family protein [Sediminispirochaeta sp.]|nr:aminopeptidase P family protein [Sediminispirochaeta sp.]
MTKDGTIAERIDALRAEMRAEGVAAYLIFGTDPHMSEYVSPRWRGREWISGFSGSAGTVAVGLEAAGLWTDSRYHLQATDQLQGSGIDLFKEGLPGTVSLIDWLAKQLSPGSVVTAAAESIAVSRERALKAQLSRHGIVFRVGEDLLDRVWSDRPPVERQDVFQHDVRYAGVSRQEKLEQVRKSLWQEHCDYLFLSSLADIAWLFNLRGSDIPYNPLFLSYALVGREEAVLLLDPSKLSSELRSLLEEEGVEVVEYDRVKEVLEKKLARADRVRVNPETCNAELGALISSLCGTLEKTDVTTELKAVKNETEVAGFRRAMVKDGVAMTGFIHWLRHGWEDGVELDEYSVGQALERFRSRQDGFMGQSFQPIVGFRENGAVIHYSAVEGRSARIDGPGLLLVDSGGHYLDGTTDITRTIALGEPSPEQREDYTTVLKGHIALARTRFPEGSRGFQLDTLARAPLWERGMQYGHGTGHGVGFFLNVHEGPQSISTRLVDVDIRPGMVCSNEPGLYREGRYGIRIENLILAEELFSTPFGRFFGFETLSLCPLERRLIDPALMSAHELEWVNSYHRRVFGELSPHLGQELRAWLEKATAEIGGKQ